MLFKKSRKTNTNNLLSRRICGAGITAAAAAFVLTLTSAGVPAASFEIDAKEFSEVGNTVLFGSYEQDGDTENGKEDIEWIVMDVQDDKALLVSKYALDVQPYNAEDEAVTWETCTLRTWLNDDFLNEAFSKEEQAFIPETLVENPDNEASRTKGGKDTRDKIFLLSLDEVQKYFPSDSDRITCPTEYAFYEGCYSFNVQTQLRYIIEEIAERYEYGEGEYFPEYNVDAGCWWWLRSPGSDPNMAAYVYVGGYIHDLGRCVSDDDGGVRPALWVNLNS
ncbi:MAG: hypothetical protein HUJ73_04320 [Eubacterium sp.]|nr:hypothetical protein [Eubacterium sp.]